MLHYTYWITRNKLRGLGTVHPITITRASFVNVILFLIKSIDSLLYLLQIASCEHVNSKVPGVWMLHPVTYSFELKLGFLLNGVRNIQGRIPVLIKP